MQPRLLNFNKYNKHNSFIENKCNPFIKNKYNDHIEKDRF